MASPDEIKLGRLVVERGMCTEEEILAALRERNEDAEGPELGERLVAAGRFSKEVLAELKRVLRSEQKTRRTRHEMSTDSFISLGSAREAIARECLDEARKALDSDRDAAVRELRRLAEEFADTESGNRAKDMLTEVE